MQKSSLVLIMSRCRWPNAYYYTKLSILFSSLFFCIFTFRYNELFVLETLRKSCAFDKPFEPVINSFLSDNSEIIFNPELSNKFVDKVREKYVSYT